MEILTKNKKSKYRIGMVVALALIVISAIMIGVTFSQFSGANKDNQNQQLETIESSIDYNIDEMVVRFSRQMDYVLLSRSFESALERAELTGNTDRLTDTLKNSSLSNLGNFEALFVTKGTELLATSSDDETYSIGKSLGSELYLCLDSAENEYLAVRHVLPDGITCYGVINIKSMYKSILSRTNAKSESVILMLDGGQTLFYESGDHIKTCNISEIGSTSDIDSDEAEVLCKSQADNAVITDDYENAKAGQKHPDTRVLAVPSSKTDNGAFAIAVRSDYSATASLLRMTAMKLILFFVMAVIGIVMLVMFLIQSRREQTLADIELEQLKEKNRQMEELNEKLRELEHHQRLETIGTMTSGIAHEFNNLLAPIMGYSIMTLEKIDPDDEALYDGVLEIYNASKKAKDIISRLSDLARKNTEKVFTRIQPDALMNRIISVTAPSLPMNVDLVRDFNCEGKYIRGNETQLTQLFINLIINAFQALETDGGTVKVGTRMVNGEVLFTVSDDGPGIKEEIRESIFDPFFTTKEAGAGTGLGLAIVLQAAEDNKGRVELETEEGKGSCFKVFIPEDPEASDEMEV